LLPALQHQLVLARRNAPPSEWTGIALQDSATVPLEYERLRWLPAWGRKVEKKMIST